MCAHTKLYAHNRIIFAAHITKVILGNASSSEVKKIVPPVFLQRTAASNGEYVVKRHAEVPQKPPGGESKKQKNYLFCHYLFLYLKSDKVVHTHSHEREKLLLKYFNNILI
jgi:hypothetical protein